MLTKASENHTQMNAENADMEIYLKKSVLYSHPLASVRVLDYLGVHP